MISIAGLKDVSLEELYDIVKSVVYDFLENESIVEDPKLIISDEQFEQLMNTKDIRARLKDYNASFEDGVAIGINIGFRMCIAHMASDILSNMQVITEDANDNSLEEVSVEPDVIEVDPVMFPAT